MHNNFEKKKKIKICVGGRSDKVLLCLRAGPSLLRRIDHRQPGQVADVPGGVSGEGASEAGNRAVHGGGVQLRRHGGVQDGGAVPGAGGGAGDIGFDPGHDGLDKQRDARGARVFVVVGASVAGFGEGV